MASRISVSARQSIEPEAGPASPTPQHVFELDDEDTHRPPSATMQHGEVMPPPRSPSYVEETRNLAESYVAKRKWRHVGSTTKGPLPHPRRSQVDTSVAVVPPPAGACALACMCLWMCANRVDRVLAGGWVSNGVWVWRIECRLWAVFTVVPTYGRGGLPPAPLLQQPTFSHLDRHHHYRVHPW